MKREDLKTLKLKTTDGEIELSDDIIGKIMKMHGTATQDLQAKVTIATEKARIADESNKKLQAAAEKLKGVDVDKLKEERDTFEKAAKTIKDDTEKEYKEKLEGLEYKHNFDNALGEALRTAKAKNPAAVKALLQTDDLKLDGKIILGLKDRIDEVVKSDGYLFDEVKSGEWFISLLQKVIQAYDRNARAIYFQKKNKLK